MYVFFFCAGWWWAMQTVSFSHPHQSQKPGQHGPKNQATDFSPTSKWVSTTSAPPLSLITSPFLVDEWKCPGKCSCPQKSCVQHLMEVVCLFVSQHPIPERLRIRVNRIGMGHYEALHFDKERLRQACKNTDKKHRHWFIRTSPDLWSSSPFESSLGKLLKWSKIKPIPCLSYNFSSQIGPFTNLYLYVYNILSCL